jgi:hypothetical protein
MAPKSSVEAWKYVKREGADCICQLCGKNFSGTLTRVVDHLLSISNGNGGGVEGCPAISDEQKDAVQRDYDKSKAEKGRKEMKRQRIQKEIGMSSSPMNSSFTSKFDGSSSTQTKTCGASTLNAF